MNDTLATLHALRSVHGDFSDRAINDEDIQTILHAAVRAANSSARQSYSIVVIQDRAVMREVCQYAGGAALVFCVDLNKMHTLAERMGYQHRYDSNCQFLSAGVDCILAAQTAVIAAKSLGIDSLLTNGVHRGDVSRVFRILDLPARECFPLVAIVLGYPTSEPTYQKGRLCGPGVIHYGRYHALTEEEADAIVAQYDDPDLHLGLISDWAQKGYAHYLDWFFGSWMGYPRAGEPMPAPPDDEPQLVRLLRETGFLE